MTDYIGARCAVATGDGETARGTVLGDAALITIGPCFLVRFDQSVQCSAGCQYGHDQAFIPKDHVQIMES